MSESGEASWSSRVFAALRFVFLSASILLILTLFGGLFATATITLFGYVTIAAYVLAAVVTPGASLVVFAAIVPIVGMTTRVIGISLAPPASAELMVLCVLLGCAVRSLWYRPIALDRVDIAAIIVAAIAGTSAAALLPIVYAHTTSTMSVTGSGIVALVRQYFVRSEGMRPIHDAALLVESAALFISARRACREAPFRLSLLRMLVAGATAAAVLNIIILGLGLLRGEAIGPTWMSSLRVLRINVHHNDLNAAGSFFVLFLCVAVGFASGRDRWWAWSAATILAAAVWLAGSRSAMAALALSAIAAFLWIASRASQRVARRVAIGGATSTLVVAAAIVALWPRAGANMALGPAFAYRVQLWQAAARMIGEHPVIGIGVGQFPLYSQRLRPLLDNGVPQGPENAHNNLLQVGAELGLPALIAVVVWIALALVPALRRVKTGEPDRLELGLVTGLGAFLLTFFVGHPLLVSVVAFPFWLALAVASAETGAVEQRFRASWMNVLFLLLLVSSISPRAELFSREANLEHVGMGLSSWRDGPDGFKYREAANCSGVFVPGNAAIVSIPVRLMDARVSPLTLSFSIDDRLVDAFRVDSVDWTNYRIRVPPPSDRSRYRFLEFRVRGTGDDGCDVTRLLVGKAFALDGTGKRIL